MRKTISYILFISVFFILASGCQKNLKNDSSGAKPGTPTVDFTPKELKNFVQVNLVGDNDIYKPQNIDAGLINGWGIMFPSSDGPWVALEGKGITATYNLDGVPLPTSVRIPNAAAGLGDLSADEHSHPTGQVINPTSDFKLPNGNAAQVIFAAADGTISGWNNGSNAVKKVDNSPNAFYSGIAMAVDGGQFYLYVANFAENKIEVYDKDWNPVNKSFVDPALPEGYSPFNIVTISDGRIYVTYAKKDASGKIVKGQGNGIINVFNPNGTLIKRFATKGKLDTPWGITIAPAGFWGEWSQLSNMILVGNNGNGQINVFDENGNYLGPLYGKGKAIEIDGLWGLAFPPMTGPHRHFLYFASGPVNGTKGLVGYIKNAYIN